jgi:NAD(P)-dependent dehydrogenase (short-subunit alcohol dehydrogenase family)
MKFDLTGKIALVTGGFGKLGSIWCKALLEAGARIAVTDLLSADKSSELSKLIDQYGSNKLHIYHADVLEKESLLELRLRIETDFAPVNILVNNAGIDSPPSSGKTFRIEDIPAESFLPVLNVNLYGAFLVSQVFGANMIKQGNGSIINIGSLYGSVSPDPSFYTHIECDPPFVKPPAYAASKAGLIQLTRYLATHWGAYGVRVNVLSPGGVEGGQDVKFKNKFCARVPLKRMANTEDLTGPLVFLASEASSYLTGHNLQIDGGFTAW